MTCSAGSSASSGAADVAISRKRSRSHSPCIPGLVPGGGPSGDPAGAVDGRARRDLRKMAIARQLQRVCREHVAPSARSRARVAQKGTPAGIPVSLAWIDTTAPSPLHWCSMERAEFERLVVEALDGIPDEFASYLENVTVVIEDEPSAELLRSLGLDPGRETLYGLYPGTPLPGRRYDQLRLPDHVASLAGPLL